MMTDPAALLREYHRALDDAKTPNQLAHCIAGFLERNKIPLPAPAGFSTIGDAHRDRVNSRGSPALCDDALNKAIREVGHG